MADNIFPIESLNKVFSDYITMISHYNKINKNVVSTSLLNACGFILSDSYHLRVTNKWVERSNIWTIIALPSGMGKSVITRNIFHQIIDYQNKLIVENRKHNALAMEYKEMIKAMIKNKKLKSGESPIEQSAEVRNWLHNNGFNETPPEFMKVTNLFSDDFTFERFATMLEDNKGHAFLIRGDEVAGLFKMFNRYRQGNDEETLLKLWGYDSLKVDRIKEESAVFVNSPIVSLFGATQKELLFDIYTENRKSNGNVFRFLFCMDGSELKSKNVFDVPDDLYNSEEVDKFMHHYLTYFDGAKIDIELTLDDDVFSYLKTWRDKCEDKFVHSGIIDFKEYNSIMGKMDSYVFRISIILNRTNAYFNGGSDDKIIKLEEIVSSTKIVEFYIQEIINVLSLTDISYRKNLKSEKEITYYEIKMPQSAPYFEIVKSIEIELGYGSKKAYNLMNRWQELGLIKRNSKGMIYKVINRK